MIYSFMERIDHDKYLHIISFKKAIFGWSDGDFTAQKVGFPYSLSGLPDFRVQTPNSESQSPMKVRTAQQTLKSERKSPEEVWTA
jgi:hypothetical protein